MEITTADGFVEITESLAEMIKYVANEPSVGLYYVQQHTQNAVPNVITLKNNLVEKSHETNLHTEDLEDSISMVQSMKEFGSAIADEMIKDIRESLTLLSAKKTRKGSINTGKSGFQVGRMGSWGPVAWGRSSGQDESGYLPTIFKSARQKASDVLESKEQMLKPMGYSAPLSTTSASTSSSVPDTELDEVRDDAKYTDNNLSTSEDFDVFKANKEAKLKEWLEGTQGITGNKQGSK